jgi:hypothetical protein
MKTLQPKLTIAKTVISSFENSKQTYLRSTWICTETRTA